MQRAIKLSVLALFLILLITLFCGCSTRTPDVNTTASAIAIFPSAQNTNMLPPYIRIAYGHVFLDRLAIHNARVEAVSTDGTDRRSTFTNESGFYSLNIKSGTKYNVTATYQGLQQTIWPVYLLENESDIYDIRMTTTPRSTIEGSGYTIGSPFPEQNAYKRWSGVVINVTPVNSNVTITALTDNNGYYSLDVEPYVTYNITGASSVQNKFPIPIFHYRNDGSLTDGYYDMITVGPRETALVDYIIPLP